MCFCASEIEIGICVQLEQKKGMTVGVFLPLSKLTLL